MQSWCDLSDLLCEEPALGGSYEKIWVMRAHDVASVPKGCKGEVLDDPVQIQAGTRSTLYKFPIETLGFQENQKYNAGGEYFELILEGFRDRISPTHQHEICKLSPGYYIVIYQDANGYVRLLGTLDKPLRFTSFADTGKKGSDDNGVLWRFYGVSKCPAVFMDPSIPPPNEELIPLARLTAFEDGTVGSCGVRLSASGSQLSDGTAITAATPFGTAKLIYSFYYGGDLLWQYSIGADEDATDIANWNLLGGSRTNAEFETQVVDEIKVGGTGFQFSFSLDVLSILDFPQTLRVELVVDDYSKQSAPDMESIPYCQIAEAFSMTTTKQNNFTFRLTLGSIEDMYVDWGDGDVEFFEAVAALSGVNYVHSYASAGSYDVKVYFPAGSATDLVVNDEELSAFDPSKLINLTNLEASSNNIVNDQDLQNLVAVTNIEYQNNSGLNNIFLPASAPLEVFLSYSCDLQNNLDFNAFASTLTEVKVYGNNNLQFFDVSGCFELEILLAYSCDIQNDQDLTGCTSLEDLKIYNNNSLQFLDVEGLSNLHTILARSCDISNQQDWTNLTALVRVEVEANSNLPGILLPVSAPLEEFTAYSCDLADDLDFTPYAATLQEVRINSNSSLAFSDVSGCSLLTSYRAYNCNILNDQDLTGCSGLERAELYGNTSLEDVDVSGLTNLEIYNINGCNISNAQDVSSSGSALETLNIRENQLPSLNLGTHPNLTKIDGYNNQFSGSLSLNNCVGLEYVDLDGNNLTDLIFDFCTNIETISLAFNNVATTELNRMVDDLWVNRSASADPDKFAGLGNNPGVLNATSLDKINGTGAYLGDGLVDHDWDVNS